MNKVHCNTLRCLQSMPQPEDSFAKMSKDTYFSKLDFCRVYHQIKMAAKDKEKTAFITPDGIFQYTKMPLGMTNSAATCNGMMRKLLKRVAHADSFVDDLITHTQGWTTYLWCHQGNV